MNTPKTWTILGLVALTFGLGACSSGAKTSTSTHAATTTTVSTPAASAPATSAPAAASTDTGMTTTTVGQGPLTPLTPQAAAAMILGINGQIQKAEAGPNGPQALTQAQAQAIVDAQNRALGLPVTKK